MFPRVVFEVAFSQKHDPVTEDARDWLIRPQGFVKLVIVIKVTEGSIPPNLLGEDHDVAEEEGQEKEEEERDSEESTGEGGDPPVTIEATHPDQATKHSVETNSLDETTTPGSGDDLPSGAAAALACLLHVLHRPRLRQLRK